MSYLSKRRNALMKMGGDDPFNGHDYVDLGLPSGTLWATKNVGAELVTDSGLFFSWGDTVGHDTSYRPQKNYKYATYDENGNITSYTKYNSTDGLTILLPEDDAVIANMGGKWKMPHVSHFTELLNNTTHEVIASYNGTNRTVCEFTSNINGKVLIVPIAGWITAYYAHNNSYGALLSNTRYDDSHMRYLRLSSSTSYNPALNIEHRINAFCVRGIISEHDIIN